MMSPEASDFAWIFVVKPPRERPSAWPSCPPLLRPRTHERARSVEFEHLNEMRRGAHGRERVEEGLEDASLAQAIEALPHAVPMTEALRQRAPANVLDGEEMKRLEEAAVVLGFPSAPRQGRRRTPQACAPNRPHPSLSTELRPVNRSEVYKITADSVLGFVKIRPLSIRPHDLMAGIWKITF